LALLASSGRFDHRLQDVERRPKGPSYPGMSFSEISISSAFTPPAAKAANAKKRYGTAPRSSPSPTNLVGRDHRSTARIVLRVVEKAGLPDDVTFHTLRHAFALMLITSLGMDVESVSRQLGHTTSSIHPVDA
jgi:hypothetical protein